MPSPSATTAAVDMSITARLYRPTVNLEGTATR